MKRLVVLASGERLKAGGLDVLAPVNTGAKDVITPPSLARSAARRACGVSFTRVNSPPT